MSIYRHISDARKAKELSVSLQCELLGVSESGYWAWARRAPSDRALLTERIRQVHAASRAATAVRGSMRCCAATGSGSERSAWPG